MSKSKIRLHRNFVMMRLFLVITPVIAYFYVNLLATMASTTLQNILTSSPETVLVFIIAMINPYIAYLLGLVEKKLETNDEQFIVINMVLLILAQILTMNPFYFMMLAYLAYRIIKVYKIDFKQHLKSFTIKSLFALGGGGFIVIFLSSLCAFVSSKIA